MHPQSGLVSRCGPTFIRLLSRWTMTSTCKTCNRIQRSEPHETRYGGHDTDSRHIYQPFETENFRRKSQFMSSGLNRNYNGWHTLFSPSNNKFYDNPSTEDVASCTYKWLDKWRHFLLFPYLFLSVSPPHISFSQFPRFLSLFPLSLFIFTSIWCRGKECLELYLHYPIRIPVKYVALHRAMASFLRFGSSVWESNCGRFTPQQLVAGTGPTFRCVTSRPTYN
jgi:hypothetical protein